MEVKGTYRERSCKTCYFCDQCESVRICSAYSPLDDSLTDREVEEITERNREEYVAEYYEYASQYDDDLFFL